MRPRQVRYRLRYAPTFYLHDYKPLPRAMQPTSNVNRGKTARRIGKTRGYSNLTTAS